MSSIKKAKNKLKKKTQGKKPQDDNIMRNFEFMLIYLSNFAHRSIMIHKTKFTLCARHNLFFLILLLF